MRPLLKNYKKFHSKLKTNRLKDKSNHMVISIKAEKIIYQISTPIYGQKPILENWSKGEPP